MSFIIFLSFFLSIFILFDLFYIHLNSELKLDMPLAVNYMTENSIKFEEKV